MLKSNTNVEFENVRVEEDIVGYIVTIFNQ